MLSFWVRWENSWRWNGNIYKTVITSFCQYLEGNSTRWWKRSDWNRFNSSWKSNRKWRIPSINAHSSWIKYTTANLSTNRCCWSWKIKTMWQTGNKKLMQSSNPEMTFWGNWTRGRKAWKAESRISEYLISFMWKLSLFSTGSKKST